MTDRDDAVPTGPRTDAADPSRNAVTHGLTAKRPLCEQEAERMRLLVDSWTMKHMPETEAEEALVQSAAIEYVRYLRCVQADEAQLAPNSRAALAEWKEKRRHAIRRRAQDLKIDPASVAADLHDSAFGIDWMARNWKALLAALAGGRGWTSNDLELALNLLGLPYQKSASGGIEAALIALAAAACPMTVDHRAAPGIAEAEAAAHLRAFVVDRIEHLAALRPLVWEDVDGPQAAAIEAAAMADTSKDGQLRQRYRREALRDMHRGIGMLIRLKVERSKMDGRQLRQEQMAKSSSSSGDDRPAWVAAREASQRDAAPVVEPAAPATNPEPPSQRNEPPATATDRPNDRHNPSPNSSLPHRSPTEPPADRRRTGPSPEAHRGAPEGADAGRPGPSPGRSDGRKAG